MSNIVVVGGGAAGTGAATIAYQTDPSLKVTLITEFENIGYSPCGIPYVFSRDIESFDNLFLQPKEFFIEMGLDLRTEMVVEEIDINERIVIANGEKFPFDKLIICTGWEYEVPDLPNVDLEGIVYLKDIREAAKIDKMLDEAKRAVVWNAKPMGVELLEHLPKRGLETHLVDKGPWLMSEFTDPDMMQPLQEHLADESGVKFHFGTELKGFIGKENGHITAVQTSEGEIPCDIAFLVAPMRPATKLAQSIGVKTGSTGAIIVDNHMRTNVPDVYAAGACVETMHGQLKIPFQIFTGTYAYTQGRLAGANVAGTDKSYTPVYIPWGLGTKVQVGGVLISETLARAMGIPCIVGKATGITAARYHPSHETMTVKLLADPDSHKVIGAAFTGGDGVKERADFMAFAIRKEATLEELATMENVYSPAIGALGEPIAFAAINALKNATNN